MKHFWVVTKPTKLSVMEDVLFENSPKAIGWQFVGGLRPGEVVGFYRNYDKGPQVVGAPYCGSPPIENIFVFKWGSHETDGFSDESTIDLQQYTREEAHMM